MKKFRLSKRCKDKTPNTCPRHGLPTQLATAAKALTETTPATEERTSIERQLEELNRYNKPIYLEPPAYPTKETEEGPHGVILPKLREGWTWKFRDEQILLYCGTELLDLEPLKVKTKKEFLKKAPRKAHKILKHASKTQHSKLVQKYYSGDYHNDRRTTIPPLTELWKLEEILPTLPDNQHWNIDTIPYLSFRIREGYRTVASHGPFDDLMSTTPLPEKLSYRYIRKAIRKTLKSSRKETATKTKKEKKTFIV